MRVACSPLGENSCISAVVAAWKAAEGGTAGARGSHFGGCADAPLAMKPNSSICRRALGDITNLQTLHEQVVTPYNASVRSQNEDPTKHYGDCFCMKKQVSSVSPWNEALETARTIVPLCADDSSVAIALMDEAIHAVLSSICRGGRDSEWAHCLSAKLLKLVGSSVAPRQFVWILERHGWFGTRFSRPPDRELLLFDLDQLRVQMAFAQVPLVQSVLPCHLPLPLTDAAAAASALETASWPKPCGQPLLSNADVTTSQAICVNDKRPGQKIQTDLSCAIVSPQRGIVEPEVFGSAARKLHFDTPRAAGNRTDGPAAPTDGWEQVAEYTTEMIEHMLILETEELPFPDYMAIQPNINGRMRSILIDWIVDVTVKYDLRYSTLFLAVSLIDRYLSCVEVVRDRLQLVGTAAVMIAAKFEELNPPVAKDFCYVAADIYTVNELFEMESSMLNHVNFNVACPTASFFLDYFCLVNGCDPAHREMVEYLAELALLEGHVLCYKPSQLAAAAVLMGNKLMGWSNVWPYQIAALSRYEAMALDDCATWLLGLLEAAPTKQLQAVRKKFSSEKRFEVAL